jgi:hypothetical protein
VRGGVCGGGLASSGLLHLGSGFWGLGLLEALSRKEAHRPDRSVGVTEMLETSRVCCIQLLLTVQSPSLPSTQLQEPAHLNSRSVGDVGNLQPTSWDGEQTSHTLVCRFGVLPIGGTREANDVTGASEDSRQFGLMQARSAE